jgi:hypothetical protein
MMRADTLIAAVEKMAERATEIACLCQLLGEHVAGDPKTSSVGFAIQGLGTLATTLGADLMAAAEAND